MSIFFRAMFSTFTSISKWSLVKRGSFRRPLEKLILWKPREVILARLCASKKSKGLASLFAPGPQLGTILCTWSHTVAFESFWNGMNNWSSAARHSKKGSHLQRKKAGFHCTFDSRHLETIQRNFKLNSKTLVLYMKFICNYIELVLRFH